MGAKTMTFAPAIFMRYWTARSASLLQQAAARPRGVWGCAPDNRGGRFSGRRSAHLRKRKTQSVSSEARGVWGCAPVDRGGLTWQADAPQERLKLIEFQPFLWRWAESNRRPNKAPEGFLHAYPAFDCRGTAAGGRANVPLASES